MEKITAYLKERFESLPFDEFQKRIRHNYSLLGVLDSESRWFSDRLKEYEQQLIPSNGEPIVQLIDRAALFTSQNDYLMDFLSQEENWNKGKIRENADRGDNKFYTELFAYTYILEILDMICLKDYRLFQELFKEIIAKRKREKTFNHLPLFHKVKLFSVEIPLRNYFKAFETGKIKPTSGGIAVAINIWEATWADFKENMKDNAFTGKVLAGNRCGHRKLDERTGAGPSGFSEDGKRITRCYPLRKEWADLYQTWNMAFVTRFSDFPMILPKLFIPSVSCYADKPEEYIYRRAIALYLYLNYTSFDLAEKGQETVTDLDWSDRELSRNWGATNKKSALDYMKKLEEAKSRRPVQGKVI